ncbi:unnamed protein product [Hyaloperonospora brassicae]|uniref:RxLR effector candidate protein n=1 Tax=Hyaloperonospora brassicae TaxID=162125 RepID=A0AAV0TXK5_HYABA|nr:unnamed protein product [Hyaloperonospora brassicae]
MRVPFRLLCFLAAAFATCVSADAMDDGTPLMSEAPPVTPSTDGTGVSNATSDAPRAEEDFDIEPQPTRAPTQKAPTQEAPTLPPSVAPVKRNPIADPTASDRPAEVTSTASAVAPTAAAVVLSAVVYLML